MSKALRKSIESNIPELLSVLVCSNRSHMSLMFSPIYRPLINPVWSVWIKKGSVDSILVAIAFAAIL